MNLPNKLTIARIALVPIYLAMMELYMLGDSYRWAMVAALVLYVAATISDVADGRIARKNNLITDFGKFMDPLADKILVFTAMICFMELGWLPGWFVIICLIREFIISGFRLVAADNGVVIAASKWGKKKTLFQMTFTITFMALIVLGFDIAWEGLYLSVSGGIEFFNVLFMIYSNICVWLSLIFNVVSLVDYMKKNWGVMGKDL